MESQAKDMYLEYPVFKGLQKPFELLGFEGRYITWAACTVGGGFVCFIICFIAIGFIFASCLLGIILTFGAVMIFLKKRKGLHSKSEEKGVFVISHSRSL